VVLIILTFDQLYFVIQRLLTTQGKQRTASSGNYGEAAEGSAEGSNTTVWPHQLHQRGGDTHVGGSTCRYVLPQ
jgi:hypothetical protein